MVHLTSRINKVFHRINSKLSRSENKGTAQVATGAASGRQTTAQSEPNETPLEGQTLPQQTASPAAIPPEPSPRPSDSHPKPGAEPALDPPTAVSQAEGAAICQPPAPVVTMKTVQPRVASAVEPKDPQSIVITIPFRSDRTTTAEYLAATATRLPSADLGPSSSSSSPAVFSGANSPTMDTDAETDSSSGSDSSDDDPMDVDEMPPPTTSSESASASADGLSSSPPPVSRPRHGQTVAEWSDELRQATCPACTKPLFLHGAAVVAHTAQALREGRALQPYITCPKCRTTACVYCGAVPALAYPVFRGASMGPSVSWCCDKGRLFLAWMLCCGPEFDLRNVSGSRGEILSQTIRTKLKGAKPSTSSPTSSTSAASSTPAALPPLSGGKPDVIPLSAAPSTTTTTNSLLANASSVLHLGGSGKSKGKGKGKGKAKSKANAKGKGYGGAQGVEVAPPAPAKKTLEERRRAESQLLELYFRALALVLPRTNPAPRPATDFDYNPPTTVLAMLQRSPLVRAVAEHLRNDSIDDMTRQQGLYHSLLDLLDLTSTHPSTSPLVFREQYLFPKAEQLVYVFCAAPSNDVGVVASSLGRSRAAAQRRAALDTSQSLVTLVRNLADQCRHFSTAVREQVARSRTVPDDLQGPELQGVLALCRSVCELSDVLQACRPAAAVESSVVTRSREAAAAQTENKEWHRQNAVLDLPDDVPIPPPYPSAPRRPPSDSQKTTGAVGAMRALATQVAMLRTALPEGIYVRYNNADMGSLGVLFVGPKDTPYENGLFEFYMSCAGGFPKKPPAVLFKTTGGGTFRFNPNLYSNGTVCLSLLGTWGGEQWNPATSTLLQVLVSIQAMIFNEEPWYNEPGREHRVNKEESARYNDQIRAATVRLGMLDWLRTRIVSPKMRGASARRVSTARGPPSGQPIVAEGSWQGQSAPAAMATKPTNKGKDAVPIMVPGAQSQSQATALQSQPQPQPQSQQAAASLQAQAAQVLHSQDSGYPAVHDSTADPLSTAYSIPFVDAAGLGPGHFDIPLPIPGKMQVYGPSVYPSIFGQAPPRTAPGPAPPPLADDSIWGPVIRRHFAQNARAIMETVQGWSEGPGAQSKTMAHRMDELREALQEHGFLT